MKEKQMCYFSSVTKQIIVSCQQKTLLLRRNRVKLIMQEHSYSYLHESIQDFFSQV